MKKFISALLCACFVLSLGLTAGAQTASGPEKLRIVSTIFPPYDFVRAIAGDRVELSMLLPPGTESHSFEPSPQDVLKIQNCDVFLYVGGATDAWVDRLLASMDTEGVTLLQLTEMVDAVEEEIVEGMEHDHGEEDDHDHEECTDPDHDHGEDADHDHDHEDVELDEHVWTSPKNAKRIVIAIAEALAELDAANADFYRTNAKAYLLELDALDAAFQDAVDTGSRTTIVFGDRFPFRYLADDYGLTYYAAFPGCATETEASAATIAFLIKKVREESIPVVFTIEFSNGKIADALCESTTAQKISMHSCHNLSKKDFEAGVTYLELMTQNAALLKEALK